MLRSNPSMPRGATASMGRSAHGPVAFIATFARFLFGIHLDSTVPLYVRLAARADTALLYRDRPRSCNTTGSGLGYGLTSETSDDIRLKVLFCLHPL